ncbi:MAG: hypothetical protein IT262_06885, partial [Saprospiraceae bacterium]|nr:hypothetical protein [Saprospiraceae bacterium]
MRTLFLFTCFMLLLKQANSQSFLAIKDSAYYDNLGGGHLQYSLVSYNPITCTDSLITIIDTTGYEFIGVADVAASPSGQIYLVMSAIPNNGSLSLCISTLNLQDGSINCLFDFFSIGIFSGNSMVCSADSVLYIARSNLVSYDLKTGIGKYHGDFPNFFDSGGDMIFQNGKLYLVGSSNQLLEINIEDPSASVIVASYPQIPQERQIYGIASNVYDCDSSDMFLMVGVQINNFDQREYDIYSLDFSTQQTSLLCTGAGAFYYTGSTTYNEFLTSDCSVRLNLDKNKSSGADSTDYQVSICDSGPVFVSDTSDMELYSGYRIDSLRLQLLPLMPGESLVAGNTPATLTLTGQNSPHLTFSNPGNVLFHDFQFALQSVYWQYNGGGSPSPGQRTVEVVLFARGGRRDTAVTHLNIIGMPQAGRDTSMHICMDASPFHLTTLLSADAHPGGVWSPALQSELFDPATQPGGNFRYIVAGGECLPDTAQFTIVVQPLPIFSLGEDANLCAGDTLELTAPANALWQDGSIMASYSAIQEGLYWSEMTDIYGCAFRDSISISMLPLQNTQETLQRCFGQLYTWNGHLLASDTTICATFNGLNSCDSTHCLTLDFYYPGLSFD